MTVQKDLVKNIYVGNSSTKEFPFTFDISKKHPEYVKVYIVDENGIQHESTDFTIDIDSKKITYPKNGEALASNKKIVIIRELPLQQQMNLENNGPYFAEDIEQAFDDAVMVSQQLAEKLSRALAFGVEVDGSEFSTIIPMVPGKSFRVSDDGKSIETTEDPAKVIPIAESLLAQTKQQATIATQKAEAAAESALSAADSETNADTAMNKSRAWAEGTKPGGDDTYSAREYAESCVASATAAKQSETNAAGSASSASSSAAAAKQSETNAAGSASSASTSEQIAIQKAKSASTSAEQALTNATNASNSASNAAQSKNAAAQSEEEAQRQAEKATSEADRAERAASSIDKRDLVSSVTELNGTVTISKGDGSSNRFEVLTPEKAVLSESPIASSDDHTVADTAWTRRTIENMAATLAPNPVMARKIEKEGNTVKLWWRDPDNGIVDGTIISCWNKTIIVKKQNSYPTTPADGIVVVTATEHNKYKQEPYVDFQDNPEQWYYRAFPVSPGGLYSTNELNRFGFWHYAIYIDETDPDENTCVHKMGGYDNYFFDRSYMNFDTDKFYWGGWENAQILPKPCMLRSNGTVDYYLNPDDYTQKAEGGTSAVTNTGYDGNAMMEWCPVFTKVERIGTRLYIYFCSEKYDDGYECYSCKKSDGNYGEHFYMPIYEGWFDSNSKMRSISSGQKPKSSTTAESEATAALKNGTGWNTTLWADEQLLQILGILFFERLNLQVACGYNPGSGSSLTHVNGTANKKGMFYGHSGTNAVGTKYFGMENWWGHRWRRCNGLITIDRRVKVKLTNSTIDGSTVTGYNRTGNGYIDTGVDVPSASESYIKEISGDPRCVTAPVTVSGASSTTYYCDAAWSAGGTMQLLLGGSVVAGAPAGLFAFLVSSAPSRAAWDLGASLSYKSF